METPRRTREVQAKKAVRFLSGSLFRRAAGGRSRPSASVVGGSRGVGGFGDLAKASQALVILNEENNRERRSASITEICLEIPGTGGTRFFLYNPGRRENLGSVKVLNVGHRCVCSTQ